MKNKKIILIVTILLVISIIVTIFLIKNKQEKEYDISGIQKQFITAYENDNLRQLDFVDIISLFGIDTNDMDEYLFISNINIEDDLNSNMVLMALIKDEDIEYYYNSLYSYIESNLLHIEDKDILKLFNEAIIKKDNNYTYMIIGKDNKMMEKELNSFYR